MSTQEAIEHLETYGYCILEERILPEQADQMARKYLELHASPKVKPYLAGDAYYQTLFGLMNFDDSCWSCALHSDVLAVARHFVGPKCRVVEAVSKPVWPGAPIQRVHVDSAGDFIRIPDVPWMINTIWMLTDFTRENGATVVVPMSHRSRKSPPVPMKPDDPLLKSITGRRGSVMMWHGGLWHGAGANTSQEIRVGLNIAYYPPWFNHAREGGHQPVWPETYERMPKELQEMSKCRVGRTRADVYETP
ncbi:MAG: phytanoyl-CoA dioxygenase family protein [Planctomycetes bacterium]|nr:phytanoyl-CoA dioxygenase family protein [Planctomycetota bacterium]